MPKLHKNFHWPRIEAYDIAIHTLYQSVYGTNQLVTYEQRAERQALMKRLRREKQKFAAKFGIEI